MELYDVCYAIEFSFMDPDVTVWSMEYSTLYVIINTLCNTWSPGSADQLLRTESPYIVLRTPYYSVYNIWWLDYIPREGPI